MFDFLESDWFNITLEIVFLILVSYDIKMYFQTKKKEYLTNIVLTIGFAIWALYPYYNSYIGWDEKQKTQMLSSCNDVNDSKLCKCIDDATFKEFTYEEYKKTSKEDLAKFLKEAKEDCLDDSWF